MANRRRRTMSISEKLLRSDNPGWSSVIKRSAEKLSADTARQFRSVQAHDRQTRVLARRALAPITEQLRDDPRSMRARRDWIAGLRSGHVRARDPRAMQAIQSRVAEGSIVQLFGPPYTAVWTASLPNAGSSHPSADAIKGTFGAWMSGNGNSVFGGAGIGMGFKALSNMPMAHVRPHFRYSYNWSNTSFLETAHTSAYLKIRAIQFGPGGQQTKSPPDQVAHQLWADGTGWFDKHKDQGDDVWPGTVQLDFPLVANQFYAIWIYCQVFADDAGVNAFSFSSSFASLRVRVPFFVVEESEV